MVVGATPAGSPARAKCDIRIMYGGDFGLLWPIQAAIVVGEPLCDLGIPSWALITLLRNENRVVGY